MIFMNVRKTYNLSDICRFVTSRTCNIENYISTENMLPNKGGITSPSNIPSGSAIAYQLGDVLISNIRPYFQKIWQANCDGACSADVLCIRANEKADCKYLYYLLSQQKFFDYVMSGAKGCKMPRGDKSQIMQWQISLPPLAEQKRIADILSVIDDKIELNRRINANLEQQAQALYKSWFGEISSNITLQEITLNITDGVHNTVKDDCSGEYLLLSCKNIVGGHLVIGPNERRINKETFDKLRKRTRLSEGDILVSTVGTVGEIVILLDPPANVEFQRSVGIIKPNISKASPYYIYCALKDKQEALKHTAHGAVQQCIFIGDLKNFEIPYSYSKKLIEFDTIVSPMFNQLTINHRESNYLTQLRDTLLPKLMSGEITV